MPRKNPDWFKMPVMTTAENAMFESVRTEMKSCRGCKFLDQSRVYTADSWEYVEKWKCNVKSEVIYEYVEMFDKTVVPVWCPLIEGRINAKKSKSEKDVVENPQSFFEI